MAYKKTSNYIPGAVGFEQKSAMDTINQIIGLGTGLSKGIQESRNRREAYNLNYINSLTKGIESNFMNDGIGGVNQIIDKLDSYKSNRMGQASPETLELLDIARMQVKSQQEQNNDFLVNKQIMMDKQKSYQDFVSDMFMYDSSNATSEQKRKIREKLGSEYAEDESAWRVKQETRMRDMMVDYSNDYANWYTRHRDRLTDGMVRDFGISQQYMMEALNAWKDDNKIDKTEFDFFYGGLVAGNADQLAKFVANRYLGEQNSINVEYTNLNEEKKNFGIIDSAIKTKEMLYGDMIKTFPASLLPSISEGLIDNQKIDSNAKINLTEDQVAYLTDESAKNSYEKIEQINSNLMGLKQKNQIQGDNLFDSFKKGYGLDLGGGAPGLGGAGGAGGYGNVITRDKYISNLKQEYGNDWANQYDSSEWGELSDNEKPLPKVKESEDFINTTKLNYSENVKNLKSNSYNDSYVKPEIKKKTEQLQLLSNYTEDLKWGAWDEVNEDLKKEFKKDKFFNKIDYDKNTGLRNNMMIKGSKNLKNVLISQGSRDKDDYSGLTYKELNDLKKEFEEDALKAKSAQEKISLMSEDISAWKRTGQWGSGNWKSTEAGKLYDSYIREVNNFQKKWSGRPKGSPIFDLNKYSSPFITDSNDNFTALSLKRGLEFFEKYIPSFFDKKNKELIEFQTKSEKSGANR